MMDQKQKVKILKDIFGKPFFINYNNMTISLNYKWEAIDALNKAVPGLGTEIDDFIKDKENQKISKKIVVKKANILFGRHFELIKSRTNFDFRLQITSKNCWETCHWPYPPKINPIKEWSLIISIVKDPPCKRCNDRHCNSCKYK